MANLYISGVTGTVDTGAIIERLLQIKQQPINTLNQKKALLQGKVSTLLNLYGALNGIQSFFNNLDVDKTFSTKKAVSSDTSVLNATATSNTPNLTMNITVNKLAQTEIRATTDGLSSPVDRFLHSGVLTLTYWRDDENSLSYKINYSAGQTLQDLVNSINEAQTDIKASVYYTGEDYRLLLTEADISKSKRETVVAQNKFVIEATGLPTELGFLETVQSAQNASLNIGKSETPVVSSSNTFSNILPGLEITVKRLGEASVTITENYSGIDSTLQSFASNYNSVISLINTMTAKGAQFQGDSTLITIKTGFVRLLNPLISSGLINYSEKDGTISINNDALNSLKTSNPKKLKEIFTKLKESFGNQLNGWLGAINTYKNINDSQIMSINQRITAIQLQLIKYEERLRREYAQLEAFISQMNEISSRLENFIVTLSEMTKGGNK
ncbi:MAG: flagellar filament capping protein FliD [Thermodesulfovibrionaceae bacterium]